MAENSKIQWTDHTMTLLSDTQLPSEASRYCRKTDQARHYIGCTACRERLQCRGRDLLQAFGFCRKSHNVHHLTEGVVLPLQRFRSDSRCPCGMCTSCKTTRVCSSGCYRSQTKKPTAIDDSNNTTHRQRQRDLIFAIACEIGVEALQECGSPGCQWLDVCESAR